MKRFNKQERRKIYLKAAVLADEGRCGCYALTKVITKKESPDFSVWTKIDLTKFPEFYLFKNGHEMQIGGWWNGNSKERVLGFLLAAEMCKD